MKFIGFIYIRINNCENSGGCMKCLQETNYGHQLIYLNENH